MCIKFNEESKVKNEDKWMFSYDVRVDFIKSERESKKADLL